MSSCSRPWPTPSGSRSSASSASCADAVCACDFTECCTVSQPTVSHHLKVLREAGVVTTERKGTYIYYALAPDFARRWADLSASLAGPRGNRLTPSWRIR